MTTSLQRKYPENSPFDHGNRQKTVDSVVAIIVASIMEIPVSVCSLSSSYILLKLEIN